MDHEHKAQSNQSTLYLKLIAQVKGPFFAQFGFERVELDTSRLSMALLNGIKSPSIDRIYVVNGGHGTLVIEALCECVINKNGKAYREYVANKVYGGPLGPERIVALERTLRNLTADLVKYLWWRKNIRLHYDEIDKIDVRWQWEMDNASGDYTDGAETFTASAIYRGIYNDTLHVLSSDFDEFYSLQEDSEPKAIPLHQELMLEVDRLMRAGSIQMEKNGRSAYLILYVALEVATKALIRSWNKEATWLIDNMPSPDLYKMYDKFINVKIADLLSKDELEQLRGMISKRNKVAHTGEAVKAETLQKHYELVKKWITAIDYECGYKWAKK